MGERWWHPRSQPAAAEYLNEQHFDENGKALLVAVPTRLDPLTGEPIEWVYAQPAAADGWNADKWSNDSPG